MIVMLDASDDVVLKRAYGRTGELSSSDKWCEKNVVSEEHSYVLDSAVAIIGLSRLAALQQED